MTATASVKRIQSKAIECKWVKKRMMMEDRKKMQKITQRTPKPKSTQRPRYAYKSPFIQQNGPRLIERAMADSYFFLLCP